VRRFLFLAGLLVTSGVGAQERPLPLPEVYEHTLENGLRLFILPRPGAPTVSFVVQYRIGSVNERPGQTGIAHLLEHLLFKGTSSIGTRDYDAELPLLEAMDAVHDSLLAEKGREADQIDSIRVRALEERLRTLGQEASAFVVSNEYDAILSANGARSLNATTTEETTTYFVELPANRAELWFAMEADRLMNPVFREFYTERDVVAEERRFRLETNPAGILYQAHVAEAFRLHPYGVPVIGTKEDLEALSRKEVEDYFHNYYGPNNAVVAIAGALDPEEILGWAREYLGSIPKGRTPPPVLVREPPQEEERRVRVSFDAEPGLLVGWRVPEATHPDGPALAMLASLLTGGRSSRIYRRLVLEDRIATGISSGTGPGSLHPGLFTVNAFPLAPNTPEEVESAIYDELERLKAEPPLEMELQRVRNQLEAGEVRRLRSSFGLALQVAESATLYGDWKRSLLFTREMEAVTAEDIQRVVRLYFNDDQRTVAILSRPVEEGGNG
jgi:predicted Zn-dependent peptidase